MSADLPVPAPAHWPHCAVPATPQAYPPVTVEVVTEPAHPLCVASVFIGHDARPIRHTPLYSLHLPHEDALLLTHAQLCALLLAAQRLVTEATPTTSTEALQ